ncbi:putative GroES-like superfamily, alcohol dehydrogenase-like, NAD(P)-binding domain superfamily [Septoria linicola]|nr:putative GroES-like superfamily, alcohol dehydrogenase-like, NAD(P)-binding domain superfamily [Septoria linicola]
MALPSTMKAIKITNKHTAEIQEVPLPKLRDDYVLVKVKSVALNPTDWKHIDKIGKGGETVGVDLCGTIVSVGSKVTKSWNIGDRIATFVHGGNESQHEDGAFGEYAVAKGDLGMHVPNSLSDDDAATMGAGIITCGQALYQSLGLPLPNSNEKYGKYLLIYGASTATGTLAIQYAQLSGAKVIAICSPRNFDLVKSVGAEEAFDYNDPDCAENVRAYTNNELELVLDCIAEGSSPSICESCISSSPTPGKATISYLLKASHSRSDVANKKTLGYTIMGEAFEKFGGKSPAMKEDFEHAKMFWEISERLVKEGKIRAHPAKVGKGGLRGVVEEGLEELRRGRVSGCKLVYRVGE